MRKAAMILLLFFTLVSLVGCSPTPTPMENTPPPENTPPIDTASPGKEAVLVSDKPRQAAPQTSEADLAELAASQQRFALDLYQVLRADPGNLFYSPYSISQALAMTYAGARGQTAEEMAAALHFSLPQERLHPAFNALDLELAKRAEPVGENVDRSFRLNIANAIWGQAGYNFLDAYLDVLAQNYGAGLHTLDFQADPERARQVINEWVEAETEERIKDLIPPGTIDPLTRLVLTNAIYFKAGWLFPFEEANTQEQSFSLLDGSQVSVPMMSAGLSHTYRYTANAEVQVVELPYEGNQVSMVILMPAAGAFEEFERSLNADRLEALLQDLQPASVILTLPRFKFEYSTGLGDPLKALGMQAAFMPREADFSGMDGSQELYIQDALHKAYVEVNEEGTEAAAATAVVVGVTSMPVEIVELKVDRPFIFLIRDGETGALLFVGRVLDPR